MMKKIFSLIFAFVMSLTMANAQMATENAKFFDNIYFGVNTGVATSLSFDEVFPVNPVVGLHLGKWFTPVWGIEGEGTFWLGSHSSDVFPGNRFDYMGTDHNFIRGSYGGVNGLVNLTNLFCGYKGTPRLFEVKTVAGTGWTHMYANKFNDHSHNGLGVRTGLDLDFNLGKKKQHVLSVRPAVLWDVTAARGTMPLQFNSNYAQLYLGVGYSYKFKTSNGTHNFKTYDVGYLVNELNRTNAELRKKPKEVEVIKEVIKEVPVKAEVAEVSADTYVFFAFDSDVLTDDAKAVLDQVTGTVEVVAYASPEGSEQYNKELSQRRADVVKAYLESRGVKVNKAEGLGVNGKASNRVAIVAVK